MRSLSVFLLLAAWSLALPAQTNIAFRSKVTFPGQNLANLWGYATGGNEYALVGGTSGLNIVDVTNPASPVQIVLIPGPTGPSTIWKEVKTYSHYAYVVSEAGFGVQIIDLNALPSTVASNYNAHSYFGDGAIAGQLNTIHALQVDESAGYLYLYGSNLNGGKPLWLSLSDPNNPTYAGFLNDDALGYAHDGYVNNNIMYSGHIYNGLFAIVDVTIKDSPMLLGTQTTPNAFTHNTWLSGSTLFTTDETSNSFLAAYDVSNPGNIGFLDKIQSNPGSSSIVHNTYTVNNYAVSSWYKDGVVIVDALRPANLVQVGNYDTYPGQGGSGYEGCWGVYPFLPSGNIIASNIRAQSTQNGELFVLTPTYVRGCYLEGVVTDAVTGQPIIGATVKLLSTSTSDNSITGGTYKMAQLASGTFTVLASKTGYDNFSTTVTLANGVLTTLNIPLQPTALPVELIRFDAKVADHTALLSWETAQEHHNAGFEVQHSMEARQWADMGFVAAKPPSETGSTYNFQVDDLSAGTHFFRLRQTDTDGKSTFSEIRSVLVKGNPFSATVQPTVAPASATLTCTTDHPTTLQVTITDETGRLTGLTWSLDVEDTTNLSIPTGNLAPGIYFVRVTGSQAAENAVLKIVVPD